MERSSGTCNLLATPCSFLPPLTTSSPGNSTSLSERLLQRPSYINWTGRVKRARSRQIPSSIWNYHHWPKSPQDPLIIKPFIDDGLILGKWQKLPKSTANLIVLAPCVCRVSFSKQCSD